MIDVSKLIVPSTDAAIYTALSTIKPGDWVLYAYTGLHPLSYRPSTDAVVVRRRLYDLLGQLEEEGRIMRFLYRVDAHRMGCLAHGVAPGVRLRLEAALERVPIDFSPE